MKRLVSALCFILVLCMVLSPAARAEENTDTLANWNLKIAVPDGTSAVLQGDEYYIYAQQEGSIPYVMVRTYRHDDPVAFLDEFTAYMQGQYPDLTVTADIARKTFGDKRCFEIDYSYHVDDYEVRDRRIATVLDGTAYLFTSKEVEALDMTVGSMLDDVVANSEFISADEAEQSSGLAAGYLYCQENGMPKYWLDFTGALTDNLVLHCWFRSGDPTFYEQCFILDLSTASMSGGGMKILKVYDQSGADVSDWFKNLTLQFYLDAAVMTVERDEKTLAGGAEDNIQDGTYVLAPIRVVTDVEKKQNHPCPAEDGPYQAEELGMWAQFYFFRNTGVFPTAVEIVENPDDTVILHLFEDENGDGFVHTDTDEWYTVDRYGVGTNDKSGETISLMQ